MPDHSALAKLGEGFERRHPIPLRIVPPMELHEVERLRAQSLPRAIDQRLELARRERCQAIEIGDALGMHLHRTRRLRGDEVADQLLDTRVDVGAIEGGDSRLDEARHILVCPRRLDGAMPTRELPATLDDARDGISRREGDPRDAHDGEGDAGIGTTVTSPCRKVRTPVRMMRKRPPQCGSGQATSASVVIQSAGAVRRCFAGSNGSNAAKG